MLSERGHDVLNIQRAGYGGNPLPTTATPVANSLPVITDLIRQVYQCQVEGEGGVILVGHSLGAAIALAIAAQSELPFPLLGVSALGIVPTPQKDLVLPDPDPTPDEPRVAISDLHLDATAFLGPLDLVDDAAFTADVLMTAFEPGMSDLRLLNLD